MIKKFIIPDIGNFDVAEVIEILVTNGDKLVIEDSILSIETDKATMEIPAIEEGEVVKVLINVGDKVSKGTHILDYKIDNGKTQETLPKIEKEDKDIISLNDKKTVTSAVAFDINDSVDIQSIGATSHASPSIRLFARNLGVSIAKVAGTGIKGRILKEDVEKHVKNIINFSTDFDYSPSNKGTTISPIPIVDFTKFGKIEVIELKRIQKISGKHLQTSWLNVPLVTQFDECNFSKTESFRKSLKKQAEKKGIKITPLVFILKAVGKALQDFKVFNSSLSSDGQSLILKKYINIGVAVDTKDGLMVPVFKDIEKKGIFELSLELMEMSQKARKGNLKFEDLQGGCFTISSLGGIGGTQFTPIVNIPEVAILGISKTKMQPVWNGQEFKPELILPFSLSFDHRVIDGATGVRFTQYLAKLIADISHILL